MKELLTEKKLSDHLKVHRNTLRNWRMMGCPYVGTERSIRYNVDDVVRWMKYRDKNMGGTEQRIIVDQKYLWQDSPEGLHLQSLIDDFMAILPEEIQDKFQDLTNNIIFDSFAAGYQAAMRATK